MKTPHTLLAAALLCSGCETLPTLNHPRSGYGYNANFWDTVPYYDPYQPAYHRYYPEELGIQRNDFIIAAEGGY